MTKDFSRIQKTAAIIVIILIINFPLVIALNQGEEVAVNLDKLPGVLNTNRFAISGTTEPNSVVKFFVGDSVVRVLDSQQEIVESGYGVQADAAGKFNATVLLFNGVNAILVVSKAGFKTGRAAHTVKIDIDAPSLFVSDILSPRKNATMMLEGSAEKGADVKYSIIKRTNETVSETIKANLTIREVNGSFKFQIDLGRNVEGRFIIIVTAEDDVGNIATVKKNVEVDNKPPEFVKINVPTEETHFSIVRVSGEVSEQAKVYVKNLDHQGILETEQDKKGEYEETEAEVSFDPLGELIGFDKKFDADENGHFSGRIALVAETNRLQFVAVDSAGNSNQPATYTVRYTPGSSAWRIGRITTIPNEVYTDNLQTGGVDVSLMFYLHYIGPTYGDIKVTRVVVSKDGSKEDNQYIGSPRNTKHYYDKNTREIFVYARLPVGQYPGDVHKLPDQMNFALRANVDYAIVEPSGEMISPELAERYGYGEIDTTPVYFETAVAVEKPLKYSKWLTPRMINKTIKAIDLMLKPIKTMTDFAGKLGMATMGACAMYVFASYFMEPDYKTMYTICDRIQCPYVPPACEEFGRSQTWTNEKTKKTITEEEIRKYSSPELADAAEQPYYRHKQRGDTRLDEPIDPGEKEQYEKISAGDYYIIKKPDMEGDKAIEKPYVLEQKDHDRYVYDSDVYELKDGSWISGRSENTLTNEEYNAKKQATVGAIMADSSWKPGEVYYTGSTYSGRYSIKYIGEDELVPEDAREALRYSPCPPHLPNAIIMYSEKQGSLMGVKTEGYSPNPVWQGVNVEDIGYNVQCTNMSREEFEKNEPKMGGVSRCYTPGPPSYDETRCLDNSVRDENPFDDIVLSTRCGCISGVRGNLDNIVKVLDASKKCLKQAYVGEVRGGYCERLLAQFVCDFVFFAIEKTSEPREQGTEGRPAVNFKNAMEEVNTRLDERYQGAFTSQFGMDSRQLVQKMCIATISADWSTFKNMVNTMARAPVEPVIGPLMPESRITSYDPFTGKLTINYLFTLGIMSGGQDVEYEIAVECDPDYANGDYCPRDRKARPIIYNGYIPRDGSISENIPLVDANAIYWYNKATMAVTYNLGTEVKRKVLTEAIEHKGLMIAECRFDVLAGISCRTITPEGFGTIEAVIGLSPRVDTYHENNKVAVKMLLRKIGEPENIYVYWKLVKPQQGQGQTQTEQALMTSNEYGTAEQLAINPNNLGPEFTALNQYLFEFKERGGVKTVMEGETPTNFEFALEKDKEVKISAYSEGRIDASIKSVQIEGTVDGKKTDLIKEGICGQNSEAKWTCTNKLGGNVKEVKITRIWSQFDTETEVKLFLDETVVLTASTRKTIGAEFPPSDPSNPYQLTVLLYKDINNDGKYDELKDEIIVFEEKAAKLTSSLVYQPSENCDVAPAVDIIYPFSIDENIYSDSDLMYLRDDTPVKVNVLDDCNKVEAENIKLMINGVAVAEKPEEKVADLNYEFTNLGEKLADYKDGEKLQLRISAKDNLGKEGFDEIRVIRKNPKEEETK